jgi:hypothetical protein
MDTKPETVINVGVVEGRVRERSASDDLYLQAIICVVIVLVVLAVGSAMMSSIQKILQNRAQNRLPSSPSSRGGGAGHEKIPYPKDIGANMFNYLSQRDFRKHFTKSDLENTTYANSYLVSSPVEEE